MQKLALLTAAIASFAGIATQAAYTVNLTRTGGYYTGSGGEFTADPGGGLEFVLPYYDAKAKIGADKFQTFCLEGFEYTGGSQVVLNTKAVEGGNGPAGDEISKATAYLYYHFAKGTLAGYNYTVGAAREASAGALQQAIWFLEGEGGSSNSFVTDAMTALGATEYLKDNWDGSTLTYPVKVMNITHLNDALSQDQLVLVPEPTTYFAAALLGLPFAFSMMRKQAAKRAKA